MQQKAPLNKIGIYVLQNNNVPSEQPVLEVRLKFIG